MKQFKDLELKVQELGRTERALLKKIATAEKHTEKARAEALQTKETLASVASGNKGKVLEQLRSTQAELVEVNSKCINLDQEIALEKLQVCLQIYSPISALICHVQAEKNEKALKELQSLIEKLQMEDELKAAKLNTATMEIKRCEKEFTLLQTQSNNDRDALADADERIAAASECTTGLDASQLQKEINQLRSLSRQKDNDVDLHKVVAEDALKQVSHNRFYQV